MTAYFAFAFTSFLWIAENPAATRFPYANAGSRMPAPQQCLGVYRFFSAFLSAWAEFLLPALLSPIIPGDPIFDLRLVQSKPIRYLLPGSTLLPHSQNFFLQFLNMRVFSFTHTTTPCIVTFSYNGLVLSIVCFYWFGSSILG